MAVSKVGIINRYMGLSSDTKPINVPIGSLFYERDTKYTYTTYDGTNWIIRTYSPVDAYNLKNLRYGMFHPV